MIFAPSALTRRRFATGAVLAAQSAIDDFRRGNPGLAVELVSADAQTKPDIASAVARAWFDRDGVDMIIRAMGLRHLCAVRVHRAR